VRVCVFVCVCLCVCVCECVYARERVYLLTKNRFRDEGPVDMETSNTSRLNVLCGLF